MTRIGFILFNALLVVALYGTVFAYGTKPNAVSYTLIFFSLPSIGLNLLLAFISMVRWFLSQHAELSTEAGTFLFGGAINIALTFCAVELLSNKGILHFLTKLLH